MALIRSDSEQYAVLMQKINQMKPKHPLEDVPVEEVTVPGVRDFLFNKWLKGKLLDDKLEYGFGPAQKAET